jgi:hypothetical protein
MQAVRTECALNDSRQTGAHVTATIVRDERVVPEVAAAKRAANDLADVDYSRKLAFRRAHEMTFVTLLTRAVDECAKLLQRCGGMGPTPMELTAAGDCVDERLRTPH